MENKQENAKLSEELKTLQSVNAPPGSMAAKIKNMSSGKKKSQYELQC